VARYTSPIPPWPSGATISYGPRRVPEVSAIGDGPRPALCETTARHYRLSTSRHHDGRASASRTHPRPPPGRPPFSGQYRIARPPAGDGRGALALAWLAAQPGVVAPIASARTLDQLAELLPMAAVTLTPDELARLDAASR
jgi:hypothetical protein